MAFRDYAYSGYSGSSQDLLQVSDSSLYSGRSVASAYGWAPAPCTSECS
jgi:hypothetical protein